MSCTLSPSTTTVTTTITTTTICPSLVPEHQFKKKRKLSGSAIGENKAAKLQNRQKMAVGGGNGGDFNKKPTVIGKKCQGKGTGGDSRCGGSKEARWAEQLLNPCAAAIEAGNLTRFEHLFNVLQELSTPSGDANHRLAAHGLHALTQQLLSAGMPAPVVVRPHRGSDSSGAAFATYQKTEPKIFRSALIKFHEVSPWFAFSNALANATILQLTSVEMSQQARRTLHVVDVGVSHGVQWPTLLDALARLPGGAPPLVRLSVAGSTATLPGPFSAAPPGYDFPSHLLRYAKSIDLNLRIDQANELSSRSLSLVSGETLVVCAQFRAGNGSPDDRNMLIRSIKELDPDLVVLSEIDGGGGGGEGDVGGFPSLFAQRAELLWKFLDSTSAAFKGRDFPERRVVEGEAARVLETPAPWGAAERRERWRERMVGLGFREVGFEEEALEAGRALLRKCDGNWEMQRPPAATAEAAGLRWKGNRVSFCSLWKPHARGS